MFVKVAVSKNKKKEYVEVNNFTKSRNLDFQSQMMNCKYIKNRGFVPKIKIKMYSNGENTIMTMRYSLYFEAELIIIITNILLIISSLLILMITTNNRYWGLYIIIFVIFCDFSFYKTFKDETEKIMQYFNENVFIES